MSAHGHTGYPCTICGFPLEGESAMIYLNRLKISPLNNEWTWDDDKVYDFVNWFLKLHKLPFRYTLENQEIVDSFKRGDDYKLWHNTFGMEKEKFTFFWKKKENWWLSNWYPSKFVIDDITFTHLEQWMMYKKAKLFKDERKAAEILLSEHPREQKELGREVQNFNKTTWERSCRQIVYDGCRAKFLQNRDIFNLLLSTKGTTLVEASPYDSIWGIGLTEADAIKIEKHEWPGTNWLGQILTELREDFKNELTDLQEKALENHSRTIIINGRRHIFEFDEISYEQIVGLAFGKGYEKMVLTVTSRNKLLVRGERIPVKPGDIFNASSTSMA